MEDEEHLDINEIKGHWLALGKDKLQHTVVNHAFLHILRAHPHMRPIWPFGRMKLDDKAIQGMVDNNVFRHHVIQIHAALQLLVNNVENPKRIVAVMEEIGSHHFFYDAYEPHLEVVEEGLVIAFNKYPTQDCKFTPEVEEAWIKSFRLIKDSMRQGMSEQRTKYLSQCVTAEEVRQIRQMWTKVKEHGMEAAGLSLCGGALRAYDSLIKEYCLDFPINIDTHAPEFQEFAKDTIEALDTTITSYEEGDNGFVNLPLKLKEYVEKYVSMEVCPSLVRKAFMEGLINMLTYVLGEVSMTENVQRTWFKMYRVLEQAIIVNIVQF